MSSGAFAVEVSIPGERDIVLIRSFRAPRALVWDALTTPELLVRWYGARGWQLVECGIDLRVGGTWRFVSKGPNGETMGQQGMFVEVERPDRVVSTEVFDDQSYPGESIVTRELAEHDGITTLTATVRLPSPEARERVLRYPMAKGFAHSCERLDAVLAELADRRHGDAKRRRWTHEEVSG